MKNLFKSVLPRLILLGAVLAPLFARAANTNYFAFTDTVVPNTGPVSPANGATSISGTGLAVGDLIVFDGVVTSANNTSADAWGAVNLNNDAAGTRGVTASQLGLLVRSGTGEANPCQIFINNAGGVNFGPSIGYQTNRVRIELTASIANSTTNMSYTAKVDQGLTGTFSATTSGTLTFTNNIVALTLGAYNFTHTFKGNVISGLISAGASTASNTVALGTPGLFAFAITNGFPAYGTAQQWLSNGVPIAGATGLTYATPPTTSGYNGSLYSVVVTNLANPTNIVTSQTVTLYTTSSNSLTWSGRAAANSNNWDYVTTNWVAGGAPTNFVDGDPVTFDDTSVNYLAACRRPA